MEATSDGHQPPASFGGHGAGLPTSDGHQPPASFGGHGAGLPSSDCHQPPASFGDHGAGLMLDPVHQAMLQSQIIGENSYDMSLKQPDRLYGSHILSSLDEAGDGVQNSVFQRQLPSIYVSDGTFQVANNFGSKVNTSSQFQLSQPVSTTSNQNYASSTCVETIVPLPSTSSVSGQYLPPNQPPCPTVDETKDTVNSFTIPHIQNNYHDGKSSSSNSESRERNVVQNIVCESNWERCQDQPLMSEKNIKSEVSDEGISSSIKSEVSSKKRKKKPKIKVVHQGKSTESSRYTVKTKRMGEVMMSGISMLWDKQLLCDLALVASEGERIPVHKCVLAAASAFFLNELSPQKLDAETSLDLPTIALPTVPYTILHTIVKFIYHGKVTLNANRIDAVHKIAKDYQLPELETACEVLLKQFPSKNETAAQRNKQHSTMATQVTVGTSSSSTTSSDIVTAATETSTMNGKKLSRSKTTSNSIPKLCPVKVTLTRVDELLPLRIAKTQRSDKENDGKKRKIPGMTVKLKVKSTKRNPPEACSQGLVTKRKRGRPRKHAIKHVKKSSPLKPTHDETKVKESNISELTPVCESGTTVNSTAEDLLNLTQQNVSADVMFSSAEGWPNFVSVCSSNTDLNKDSGQVNEVEEEDSSGSDADGTDSVTDVCQTLGQITSELLPETPYDWFAPIDWDAHATTITDSEDKKRKVYSCPQCHKIINKLQNFRDHVNVHTGQKPYACPVCNVMFRCAKNVRRHIQSLHKDYAPPSNDPPPYVPSDGPFDWSKPINWYSHAETVTDFDGKQRKVFTCPGCNKVISKLQNFKDHVNVHTGQKPYLCSVCNMAFRCSKNVVRHMLVHQNVSAAVPSAPEHARPRRRGRPRKYLVNVDENDNRPVIVEPRSVKTYECGHCHKVFNKQDALRDHERLHTGEKPFMCTQCGETFRRLITLRHHERAHQGELTKQAKQETKCEECGLVLSSRKGYQAHKRNMHSNRMGFLCQFCGKVLRGRNDHSEHEVACSGQKPFICNTCGKGFARKRYLDEHIPIHNKEFNYVCPICSKRFSRQDNLRVHKRIHTGKRPYKCIHCGESFRVNCLLKSHMRRYHGAEKPHPKEVPEYVKKPRNRNPNRGRHGETDDSSQEVPILQSENLFSTLAQVELGHPDTTNPMGYAQLSYSHWPSTTGAACINTLFVPQ